MRKDLLDWFGDIKQFIVAHYETAKYYSDADTGMEDYKVV
jgi:hypothetical protein